MAGTSKYTALLDANVLYPSLLRDILLSLAHAYLYIAKWSKDIRNEWTSALINNKPDKKDIILAVADIMDEAIPDCLVYGYEHLVDSLVLPDKDDRHVLAAAITGHADAIITLNVKDFPEKILDSFGIEIQTPDEFVLNQIMLKDTVALVAFKAMRERWERPHYTAQTMVDLLEKRGLSQTSAYLRDYVELT